MIPTGEQWDEIAAVSGGDLAVTSYAVLLAAMARSERTGVLRLARQPVQKQVFLAAGRPVECRSNLAHETFGRFLRNEGCFSEKDHNNALSDSLDRRIPLGEVLIERGLLSPHEIYRYLQKNLARKLLDAFTWEHGEFEIGDFAGGMDPTVKVNAPQLILTGVLKLTPRAEIDSGISRFRQEPLSLDPNPVFESTQLRLSDHAQRVVQALEAQPLTLEELTARLSLPSEDLDRIAYALVLVGRLLPARDLKDGQLGRLPDTEETAATRAEPAAIPAPEAASIDPPDDHALLLRRASIVEAYLSFNRKDSFEFLELDEGATVAEIDQAYLKAAATYAPWSLGAQGSSDFAEQGEILFLKAAQAYTELRNSESRGTLLHRRKVLRDEEAGRAKPKFSIETNLLDSEEQFKKGLSLIERGELGKALELLEFAVDCDSQNALYRAELAYRRDQFDPRHYRKQSINGLIEAVRIDATCGLAHYYLGLILGDQGDVKAAEEALRSSIKLMTPDRRPIEALKELSAKKKR